MIWKLVKKKKKKKKINKILKKIKKGRILTPAAKQILKKYNTHGYEFVLGPRKELHQEVCVEGGKKLWVKLKIK